MANRRTDNHERFSQSMPLPRSLDHNWREVISRQLLASQITQQRRGPTFGSGYGATDEANRVSDTYNAFPTPSSGPSQLQSSLADTATLESLYGATRYSLPPAYPQSLNGGEPAGAALPPIESDSNSDSGTSDSSSDSSTDTEDRSENPTVRISTSSISDRTTTDDTKTLSSVTLEGSQLSDDTLRPTEHDSWHQMGPPAVHEMKENTSLSSAEYEGVALPDYAFHSGGMTRRNVAKESDIDSIATSDISELTDLESSNFSHERTSDAQQYDYLSEDLSHTIDRPETATHKQERYKDPSCYFSDGKRAVDFVLIYKMQSNLTSKSDIKAETRKRIYRLAFERKLEEIGLQLEHEIPEQCRIENTAAVKVHATEDFLAQIAELTATPAPISIDDSDSKGRSCMQKCCDCCFHKTRNLLHIPEQYRLHQQSYFHARFERKFGEAYKADQNGQLFTTIQRLRIVAFALERVTVNRIRKKRRGLKRKIQGKKEVAGSLTIEDLCTKGIYTQWYPLHDSSLRDYPDYETLRPDRLPLRRWLCKYWGRYATWYKQQPLDEIREYFGEQIAIYFAWLGYYTKMLIIPALFSLLTVAFGIYRVHKSPVPTEVCDDNLYGNTTMCPMCANDLCSYYPLKSDCSNAKLAMAFDHYVTNLYAIFMSVWTICFLEFWKRKQSTLASLWDTIQETDHQGLLRARYKVKVQESTINPTTRRKEARMESREKYRRIAISIGSVLTFILCVISVICGIQIYKRVSARAYAALNNPIMNKIGAMLFANLSGSIMNAVFIAITNIMYSKLAWRLTNYEFPRTQEEFEKSYIYKVVLFQFINFYGLLLYMAVMKGKLFTTPDRQTDTTDQCPPSGCIPEVIIQLIIIMTGKQILNNVLEICMPLLKNFIRRKKTKSSPEKPKDDGPPVPQWCGGDHFDDGMNSRLSRWEEDFPLQPMTLPVAFGDYLEMVIQYGFTTMFAPAFPPAALFALLNNILEIRLDAQKYLQQSQRLRPYPARNIGPWMPILQVFTRMAIFTNALILAFTTQFVDRLVYSFLSTVANYKPCNYYNPPALSEDILLGYVPWRLSEFSCSRLPIVNVSDVNLNVTGTNCPDGVCYFIGFYKYSQVTDGYEPCPEWWFLLVARLGFVVLFEHVTFVIQIIIKWLIPDIPEHIELRQDREKYLARQLFVKCEQEKREKNARMNRLAQQRKMGALYGETGSRKEHPLNRPLDSSTLASRAKRKKEVGFLSSLEESKTRIMNIFRKGRLESYSEYAKEDEEPKAREIRPPGYEETKRRKQRFKKPLLMHVYQRLNLFC